MGAVLQLERFDRAGPPPPPPLHTAEELQDAYAAGVMAGRAEAEAETGDALRAALSTLSRQVQALEAALADERTARARSLAPLIGALLDGVLPALARARLESALLAAFIQLAENVAPLSVALRCGPDLADFVAACVREAALDAVTLDPEGPPGTVTAELLGGVMAWDEAAVAAQLRLLVQEIMEEH